MRQLLNEENILNKELISAETWRGIKIKEIPKESRFNLALPPITLKHWSQVAIQMRNEPSLTTRRMLSIPKTGGGEEEEVEEGVGT